MDNNSYAKDDKEQGRRGVSNVDILNGTPHEYDYDGILGKIGFGKAQWLMLLMGGMSTLNSLVTQTIFSIIAIASQCEFATNQAEKGIMMAASVAGIFLSTYFWGYASDAFGRRIVLIYGTTGTVILQFISMFVTNVWVFNVINFFVGISLGAASAAMYSHLSEFNRVKHSAIVINFSSMFVSVAAIYVPAISWLVLSYDWSIFIFDSFIFRPWRMLIFLSLLPGLVTLILLVLYPESPKFLLAKGRQEEARKAVEWICKFNTGRSVNDVLNTPTYTIKSEQADEEERRKGCGVLVSIWKATVPLFNKPHNKNFIISATAVFGLFFGYSGIQLWYPEIVNRSSGKSADISQTICEVLDVSFAQQHMANTSDANITTVCDAGISTKTYIDNIIVGCAFLAGFLLQGALLRPLGRKNVLLGAIGITTICGILLQFITNSIALLILFCLFILMPGLAISTMCGAVVDLIPVQLSSKAISICLTVGRLGIIVSTNLIGVMLEPMCSATFAIFTIAIFICGVLIQRLPV